MHSFREWKHARKRCPQKSWNCNLLSQSELKEINKMIGYKFFNAGGEVIGFRKKLRIKNISEAKTKLEHKGG